jgi:hypothetical protein
MNVRSGRTGSKPRSTAVAAGSVAPGTFNTRMQSTPEAASLLASMRHHSAHPSARSFLLLAQIRGPISKLLNLSYHYCMLSALWQSRLTPRDRQLERLASVAGASQGPSPSRAVWSPSPVLHIPSPPLPTVFAPLKVGPASARQAAAMPCAAALDAAPPRCMLNVTVTYLQTVHQFDPLMK